MKKRRATTGDKPAPKKTTESRRKSMYSSRPMPDSEPDVQQQPQHKRMTTKTFKVPPQQQKQRRQTTDSSKADPAPKKPPRRKTIETERVRTRQSRRKETESPPPPPPDEFEDIPNTPKPTTITAALREFKKGIDEINENDNSVPRRTNSVLCNLVQFPSQAGFSSTPEAGINFCSLTHGSVIVQLKPNASRKRSNTGDSAFNIFVFGGVLTVEIRKLSRDAPIKYELFTFSSMTIGKNVLFELKNKSKVQTMCYVQRT